MRERLMNVFQYISITYTISIVIISILNMCMYGMDISMCASYLVQVFFLLVFCWGIEVIMDKIEFIQKLSDKQGILLNILLEYGIVQLFAYLGNWYRFNTKNIIVYSIVFLAIEYLARRAFFLKWKAEESALNDLIQKQNEE